MTHTASHHSTAGPERSSAERGRTFATGAERSRVIAAPPEGEVPAEIETAPLGLTTLPTATPAPPEGEAPSRVRETVWLFPKTGDARLSANFSLREFRCRCTTSRCHFTLLHPTLVATLQTLRELVGRPLLLTSGFRCGPFNRIVGGGPRSYHTRGMAADVLCQDLRQVDELGEAAARIPAVGGIGTYPLRRFVHVDVRPRGAAGALTTWSG